jgi:hypothetical protein
VAAPGHHAGVTVQEATYYGMKNHPEWIQSSENCAVLCQDCHREFAHDGGHFRTALEDANEYHYVYIDPKASRALADRQSVVLENIQSRLGSFVPQAELTKWRLDMPTFDDRKNDPTRDNLFGADAGPKAELGPAKTSEGGQGDNNDQKKDLSLQDLQAPKTFTTSYADFQKSIESARQRDQANAQQQRQSGDLSQAQEAKVSPPPPKQEQKQ